MERGCRNCMWLYHMVTHNPTAPCSECLDYNKWQTIKTTHYDEIRAMSVEEMAVQLALPYLTSPPWCSEHTTCPYISEDPTPCDKCALDWLKQEVSE